MKNVHVFWLRNFIHVYRNIYTCIHTNTHAHICMSMFLCVHTCMYVHICWYICTCMYWHLYWFVYICVFWLRNFIFLSLLALKKNSNIGGRFPFWKADSFWQRHKVFILFQQSLHSRLQVKCPQASRSRSCRSEARLLPSPSTSLSLVAWSLQWTNLCLCSWQIVEGYGT